MREDETKPLSSLTCRLLGLTPAAKVYEVLTPRDLELLENATPVASKDGTHQFMEPSHIPIDGQLDFVSGIKGKIRAKQHPLVTHTSWPGRHSDAELRWLSLPKRPQSRLSRARLFEGDRNPLPDLRR